MYENYTIIQVPTYTNMTLKIHIKKKKDLNLCKLSNGHVGGYLGVRRRYEKISYNLIL